jgi:hypothetical protein
MADEISEKFEMVPKPVIDEDVNVFIDRCMIDQTMVSEFPDEQQRKLVCYTSYDLETTKHRLYKIIRPGWQKHVRGPVTPPDKK